MRDVCIQTGLGSGALAALLLLPGACSSVHHNPAVAERVAAVSEARLAEHIAALMAIGPRPQEDELATECTLQYLTTTLQGYGYEVRLEPFAVQRSMLMFARVRPVDDDAAEPTEVPIPGGLMRAGAHTLAAASERFREQGLEVVGYSGRANPDSSPLLLANLLAELPGSGPTREVLELGAHYDSVPFCPGADDNASGVAALLEVARVLADARPARGLRFCFFGAEETGLRGSAAHVAVLRADPATELGGFIGLDGVGYTDQRSGSQRSPIVAIPFLTWLPSAGNFLLVAGNWDSGWLGNLYEDCIDEYAPELPYFSANRLSGISEDSERSDHASYWHAGYPAILLSDTAEFRTDTYHLPSDTAETLDFAFLRGVTVAVAAAALHWADDD